MHPTLRLALLVFFISSTALAEYPTAMQNHNLRESLTEDSDRLLPKPKMATFAIDGNTWFRTMGTQDFYHGFGYWIQGRTEISPDEHYRINARTIFYSGSSSEGYASPVGFYNMIGFFGIWPQRILGATASARVVDLERQTVGNGLLIQDQEMNGFITKLEWGEHAFYVVGDSTGALVSDDDMINPGFTLFNGLVEGGALIWTASHLGPNSRNRVPNYYISSAASGDNFGYLASAGERNKKYAGLLALETNVTASGFAMQSRVEGRYYQDGFGDDFVGRIEHEYISYDQYDKAFTNAKNIFVYDDDVAVYALHLNLSYRFNRFLRTYWQSEIGRFDYNMVIEKDYHFYRAGVMAFPLVNRNDDIEFFVSNKIINESYVRPPSETSAANLPLFKKFPYLGVEAHFRF